MSTRKHGSLVEHLMDEQAKRFTMPDMSHVPEDAGMDRLDDASRVMATVRDGNYVIHSYVHGPLYSYELARLGITTRFVRFRQEPLFKPEWTDAVHPPEVAKFWGKPIPEELRGCTGTFVISPWRDDEDPEERWLYKYTASAQVRVHRPRHGVPGAAREPQQVVEAPLVWLEGGPPEAA